MLDLELKKLAICKCQWVQKNKLHQKPTISHQSTRKWATEQEEKLLENCLHSSMTKNLTPSLSLPAKLSMEPITPSSRGCHGASQYCSQSSVWKASKNMVVSYPLDCNNALSLRPEWRTHGSLNSIPSWKYEACHPCCWSPIREVLGECHDYPQWPAATRLLPA